MGARAITVTSGKGGVGKTTTTANIGVALALGGLRVACIDADIGLRNLDVVMGLENRIVYDIVDVVEGRARLRQALIRDKRLPELCLLPAAQTRDKSAVTPAEMVQLVEEMRKDFDFILIDSPAGIEQGFKNAVAPADDILIVTTPEVSAVRDADRIIGLVEAEEKEPPRLIINRLKPTMVQRGDMLSQTDVLDVFGAAELSPVASGPTSAPEGLGQVSFAVEDGAMVAHLDGSTLRSDVHNLGILLLDATTREPVSLDYGYTTERASDGAGIVTRVRLPLPAGKVPARVTALLMADTYPAAEATLSVP